MEKNPVHQMDKDRIEKLIDDLSLSEFLFSIGDICREKASYSRDFEDLETADAWDEDADAVDEVADKVNN